VLQVLNGLTILVISSVRPLACERDGWLTSRFKKTYSADAVQYGPALGQGESVVEEDESLLVGPGLFCTLYTQPNHDGDSAFQNNYNNSSNKRNNRQ
jgi:hypothetical protein